MNWMYLTCFLGLFVVCYRQYETIEKGDVNMDYEALGRRIRQQRKLLDMTQEQLGKRVGVSTSYIGHIERGLKHCTLDTLIALCDVLEVTPEMLLQDSLPSKLMSREYNMSSKTRSILNGIANVLREYDSESV